MRVPSVADVGYGLTAKLWLRSARTSLELSISALPFKSNMGVGLRSGNAILREKARSLLMLPRKRQPLRGGLRVHPRRSMEKLSGALQDKAREDQPEADALLQLAAQVARGLRLLWTHGRDTAGSSHKRSSR